MANGQAPGTPVDDGKQLTHDFIIGQMADVANHLRDVANAALETPDEYTIITGMLDNTGTGVLMIQDLVGSDRMDALRALKTWVDARIAEATH